MLSVSQFLDWSLSFSLVHNRSSVCAVRDCVVVSSPPTRKFERKAQMLNNPQPPHLRVGAVMGWISFLSGYKIRVSKIQDPQPNASIPISCPFAFFL